MMKQLVPILLAMTSLLTAAGKPNILVIVSDDQGYADAGFQGCADIPTPQLDRLARDGVRCTQGYVTHPFCSPSRAGFLSGRYQQRFGHENNVFHDPTSRIEGLPLTEKLLPAHLKEGGYTTGWIGKWHLGAAAVFHPLKRGFDESFGFIGGGHRFMDWKEDPDAEYLLPIERNGSRVDEPRHLTRAFGSEAAAFIRRHESKPWFLYLAFNAPHTPHEPTAERLRRFSNIKDAKRRRYAAQLSLMDDSIGEALSALRETSQDKRTLVFFFSDNGGPVGESGNGSINTPLRGGKGTMHEGGLRVPFLITWPDRFPAGRVFTQPVSSLDVFATSLAAAGLPVPGTPGTDGVNLVPHLNGETSPPEPPHKRLLWRSGRQSAIREGDLKLIQIQSEPVQLFDLHSDPGETRNLATERPADVQRLTASLDAWNRQLIPPAFPGLQGRRPKPQDQRPPAHPAASASGSSPKKEPQR